MYLLLIVLVKLRSCTYPVINLLYLGKGERFPEGFPKGLADASASRQREKGLILIVLSRLLGFSVMVQNLNRR